MVQEFWAFSVHGTSVSGFWSFEPDVIDTFAIIQLLLYNYIILFRYLNSGNDLILNSASEHDSGIFICTASNEFGSVERNFTLFVYGKKILFSHNVARLSIRIS